MKAQKKSATGKMTTSADQMKQFAEFYARFINEHGYGAWGRLLDDLQKELGIEEGLGNV